MKPQSKILAVFWVLTLLSLHTAAEAQWTHSAGVVVGVSNEADNEDFVAVGDGGVVVVWYVEYEGNGDIYAQRLDDHGMKLWGENGITVCGDAAAQIDPHIAPDGSGGYYVTWQDQRNNSLDIYGQRLAANGVAYWTTNGIPIAAAPATEANHRIVPDGFGGMVVVWNQFLVPYYQIWAHRVAADGSLPWGSAVTVASTTASLRYPALVILPGASESETRVTIAWQDYRNTGNGADIYAQRLTLDGVVQWGSSGKVVYAGLEDQLDPQVIASSSTGGTFVAWWDDRDSNPYGYCQKLDRYGNRLLPTSGKQLSMIGPTATVGPRMVSDGAYGAVIACGAHVFRLDVSGGTLWDETLATSTYSVLEMVPVRLDNGDFVAVAWDWAYDIEPWSVYGYRLDGATGEHVWGYDPVLLTSEARGGGLHLAVVASGDDVYALWKWANWAWILSVQRLDVDEAYWGYPRPLLTAVTDVPQDEGGWLDITIRAPSNDASVGYPEEIATGYNVWRRVQPETLAKAASGQDVMDVIATSGETAGMVVTDQSAAQLGLPEGDWQSLGFHAAMQQPYYDLVVPTRTDATGGSEPYEVFVVTVHTATPTVYFASLPDSAFSVDNLAPGLLQGLTGVACYDPEGLDLAWQAAGEDDLANYVVHRDTDPTSMPTADTYVASPSAPNWHDGDWTAGGGQYYWIAAVDRHGNVGPFALLSPDGVSGTQDHDLPALPGLAQNHPNPFNPWTKIAFVVPGDTPVMLHVFDMAGHRVRELVSAGGLAPGRHEVVWDGRDDGGSPVASGTYFYRLDAGGFSETKRMVLIK